MSKKQNGNSGGSTMVQKLLELQAQIKVYHWQTKSYARHIASDKFFEKAGDIIDRLVESYLGTHKTFSVKAGSDTITLKNIDDKEIVRFLETIRTYLVTDLPKTLDEKQAVDVLAIRDELVEQIDITLYLFQQH